MSAASTQEQPWCVLVVEDERRLCDMLLDALPDMGFRAIGASSAKEALRVMEATPCRILILDLRLPGMSGLDLFDEIHARWPETAVVILTGCGDLDAARRAIQLEVVEFLTKPASLGEIEQALERARQRVLRNERAAAPAAPPPPVAEPDPVVPPASDPRSLQDIAREHILAVLNKHNGNRADAADELGISVRTLYYRLSEYQRAGYLPQRVVIREFIQNCHDSSEPPRRRCGIEATSSSAITTKREAT